MSPVLLGGGAAALIGSYVMLQIGRRKKSDSSWLAIAIVTSFVVGLAAAVKGFAN